VESLLFFEDILLFNSLRTSQEKILKAREIIDAYLKETSELEVNVNSKFRKALELQIDEYEDSGEINSDLFSDIANEIVESILLNSYSRFESSKIAQELLKKIKKK
jgi:protein tyrosine/serine phosphatase